MTSKRILTLLCLGVSLCCAPLLPVPLIAADSESALVHEEANKGGYQLIDVNSLWQFYTTDKGNLVLVDTRQEWEYHAGYIQGALNFPFEPTWLSRLTNRGVLEQFLGSDKNKTFVFY